jgi:hypothetical protein
LSTYLSPKGSPIVGTLEIIHGVANCTIHSDGTRTYDGGTDVDWDSQETVVRDGKVIFVDEDGEEWTFDQLKLEDDEDDGIMQAHLAMKGAGLI